MKQRPVALVTGARRGIGAAIALALAEAGFDIAITDVQLSDELNAVCERIVSRGGRAIAVVSDLSDVSEHEHLFKSVEAALGPVTCLVNNAGVSVMSRGDLLDVTQESYDRCLDVNTRGTFFLMQAFGKRVRDQHAAHRTGGFDTQAFGEASATGNASATAATIATIAPSIITVTSSNAIAASPLRGEYCVSKAGLSMATTLFSLRLAELGVAVYEVQPGLIETEMTAPSKARYDALIDNGLTAIDRWGTPQEVARTVRTLATGGLPYSVGQVIRVDGGLLVSKY